MDEEIEGVLINMVTSNNILVKKYALEVRGTSDWKIKTRSQVNKSTQIQILDKENKQSDDESFGEGNLDIGGAGKEVIILDEIEALKEK